MHTCMMLRPQDCKAVEKEQDIYKVNQQYLNKRDQLYRLHSNT